MQTQDINGANVTASEVSPIQGTELTTDEIQDQLTDQQSPEQRNEEIRAAQKPAPKKMVGVRLSSKAKDAPYPNGPLMEGITNFGMHSVEIPNKEAQIAGFEMPEDVAGEFVAQYRQFKFDVKKGEDVPNISIK